MHLCPTIEEILTLIIALIDLCLWLWHCLTEALVQLFRQGLEQRTDTIPTAAVELQSGPLEQTQGSDNLGGHLDQSVQGAVIVADQQVN